MQRPSKYPEITDHIALYIKGRRGQLKLSLDELAARIGSSKSYVWELENKRAKHPSLWTVLALCEGLQCSLNDLLGRDVSQPLFTASEMALIDAHRRIFVA